MHIETNPSELASLIKDAHKGTLVLPQFQRSFVWAYADVLDFLHSIFRGYFVGTFLFLDCDKDNIPFDYRPIEGVKINKEDLRPEKLILDGQQRITTLHYVLYSPKCVNLKNTKHPYRFFLDLNKLYDEDIDEEAIFGCRQDETEKYYDSKYQYENRIIPFSILQSIKTWDEWEAKFSSWLITKNQTDFLKYAQKVKPIWTKYINQLFFCVKVPVVELGKVEEGDEKGLAEICAVFEKMNTTGVQLSVFDLLTARLYKDKIDLRKLWENSLTNYRLLERFSEGETNFYGVFVLRIIALMRGIETKSKALINLDPKDFERDWENAVKYLEKALERVTFVGSDGFGVFGKKWLPYPPMLPILATVLYQVEEKKLGNRAYKILKKWYWGSVFGERFQSAVESKTTSDYKSIMRAIEKEDMNTALFQDIDAEILYNENFTLQRTSRVNATYKGVMNLLALNGAKDFNLEDNINLHELDDHHIFPVKYLHESIKDNIKKEEINTVLNKTLLSQSTNRRIGKKPPSKYLKDKNIIQKRTREEILKLHLMDLDTIKFLLKNDYTNFIKNRDKYIVNKIKKEFIEIK